MKNRISLLFLCLFALILSGAFKGDDWLEDIFFKLEHFETDHPQEKVHLQLDKPYYSIGDDIWFKAYVVNAVGNELSILSEVLYVDLVDDRDSIHQKLTLPIVNGLANGDIKITDSLFTTGTYHIKAYTRWMRNFDTNFIYSRDIYIGDARTQKDVIGEAKFAFEQPKLHTEITYLNLTDKTPVANKLVTYQLLYKNKIIASGKAQTNGTGTVNINETIKDGYSVQDVFLQTAIDMAPGNSLQKNFRVYNPAAKTDVQFFPEGGHLVNGLRSKVAFKATLANGIGANVKGYIIDQSNRQISTINTSHAGMGVFALQPMAGSKYTAVITDNSGVENRYDLPVADNEGYVISVNNTNNDSITIRLTASQPLINQKELALVAQQNGVVKFASKIKFDQKFINTRLAQNRFATGLVHFTLFSDTGVPIAERLVFANNNDQLKVTVNTDKSTYAKRDKIEMGLTVTDDKGNPIQGNFSVAVTDGGSVHIDQNKETSIYSNLLLTSDLKGFIEDPNYYFIDATPAKMQELDNLLLTQGWSRFTWAQIKEDKQPVIPFKAQKSLDVSGKITTLSNKPVPYGKVTLFASTQQGSILIDTTADANGDFIIDNLNFTGDVKMVVKAAKSNGNNNLKIVLNKPKEMVYDHSFNTPGNADNNSILNYLINKQKGSDLLNNGLLNKTVQLKEVNIREKRINTKNEIHGSHKLSSGTPDIVIKKEGLVRYTDLLSAFYGLVGIEVKGGFRHGMVYRLGRRSSINGNNRPMLVLVNGNSIMPDMLADISPADVEGIEIFKADYNLAIYGDAGSSGVIEVTLKDGSTTPAGLPATNISQITSAGYSVQREFYSPVYDNPANVNKGKDVRSTIYWNPNLEPDTDGKIKATYFAADQPGDYRVVIEGVDIDGRLARQVYTFKVK